jgi:organic hydroperoxide reductase OsmC/OhrA
MTLRVSGKYQSSVEFVDVGVDVDIKTPPFEGNRGKKPEQLVDRDMLCHQYRGR